MADKVVRANADFISAAASEALLNAAKLRETMAGASQDLPDTAKNLAEAERALAEALASYQQAEIAVFYVNPDSADELALQPDPLGAGTGEEGVDAFAEIADRLSEIGKFAKNGIRENEVSRAVTLLLELTALTERLEADLGVLSAAWEPGGDANFRESIFLISTQQAVARIFQGMLAISGDVLPRRWPGGAKVDAAQVDGRVRALGLIFEGRSEQEPGLRAVVSDSSPDHAAAVQASLARAAALAEALKTAPESGDTQKQLLSALGDVTRQLALAAEALGIRIVEVRE